jgi:phage anti-repressor protein
MNTHALVPTFEGQLNDTQQTLCNARDLHSFLEVGRDFTTWIKARIEQYGFVQELDYLLLKFEKQVDVCSPVLGSKTGRGGHNALDYHLSTAFAAYEVLEQLISPTRDNSQEDLSHISREGLGQLLSLVNSAMRQRIANTELAANTAYAMNCASDLAPARAR